MSTIPSNTSDFVAARPRKAGSGKRWGWLATLGALFIFNLCVFVPWEKPNEALNRSDQDASWIAVMNWGHLGHVDFGRDLIFTHGPLGFVEGFFAPGTFCEVLAAWVLLSTACFLGLERISRVLAGTWWHAVVFLVAAILLLGMPVDMNDARMMLPSWLLLLIYFYIDDRTWSAGNVLLALSLSLFSLVKFSVLLAGVPVVGLIAVDQILRRRAPSMLIVYAAGLLVFWVVAGQRLDGVVPYLKHSWNLANGFVEALSIDTATETKDVAEFVVTALLLLAAMAVWSDSKEPSYCKRATGIVGGAILLLVIFKQGYVRHDLHEIGATAELAVMSVTLYAAIWPRVAGRAGHAFLAVLCLSCVGLSWSSQSAVPIVNGPEQLIGEIGGIPDSVGVVVDAAEGETGGTTPAPIPGAADLPKVKGSVDIYSWGQRALLADGMDYRPRPVFQSYLAMTPELARLNAEFLAGAGAPETILFDLQTIDNHYPAQEDGLSWPELLTRYDLTDAGGSRLVLHRSAQARPFSLTPISTRNESLMHFVAVPSSDDPIWVSLHVNLTALGKLMRSIYKPPELVLGIRTRDGTFRPFRLIRQTAEDGFLLSPRISNRMEFAMLYGPDWKRNLAGKKVTEMAVAVLGSGTSVCYEDQYTVNFSSLRFGHPDVAGAAGIAAFLSLENFLAEMKPFSPDDVPTLTENDQGKYVIKTAAQSQIGISAPAGSREFQFGFGLMNSAPSGLVGEDGVAFRVYAVNLQRAGSVGGRIVWQRQLNPAKLVIDRGLHRATIQLPVAPSVLGVILETMPGPASQTAEPYWTDLAFH